MLCALLSSWLRTGAKLDVSSEPRFASHRLARLILLICYVFQQFYLPPRARVGVLITDARCRALVRVARRLVVEMIASEAFGVILCVQVQIECFSQGEALDFTIILSRWCCLPP